MSTIVSREAAKWYRRSGAYEKKIPRRSGDSYRLKDFRMADPFSSMCMADLVPTSDTYRRSILGTIKWALRSKMTPDAAPISTEELEYCRGRRGLNRLWVAVRNGCCCKKREEESCDDHCTLGVIFCRLADFMSDWFYSGLNWNDKAGWVRPTRYDEDKGEFFCVPQMEFLVVDPRCAADRYALIGFLGDDYADPCGELLDAGHLSRNLAILLERMEEAIYENLVRGISIRNLHCMDIDYGISVTLVWKPPRRPAKLSGGIGFTQRPEKISKGAESTVAHYLSIQECVRHLHLIAASKSERRDHGWKLEAIPFVEERSAFPPQLASDKLGLSQRFKQLKHVVRGYDPDGREEEEHTPHLLEKLEGRQWPYCLECISMPNELSLPITVFFRKVPSKRKNRDGSSGGSSTSTPPLPPPPQKRAKLANNKV